MLPDKIIIHHSAGPDDNGNNTAAIRRWHTGTPPNGNGWVDCGYHALCEKVGDSYEVLMGRPWTMNGAHCVGQNDRALGLCIVGDWMLAAPPEAQLRVAARFVAMWCRVYRIPVTEIYRHSFFNSTDCPGDYFDLEQFKNMALDY